MGSGRFAIGIFFQRRLWKFDEIQQQLGQRQLEKMYVLLLPWCDPRFPGGKVREKNFSV
jgi:hypothetical protein